MSAAFSGWTSRPALVALVLGAGLRFWAVVTHPGTLEGDSRTYNELALSLLHSHRLELQGRPTAAYPPGYPVFLAAVYATAGPHPENAYAAQAGLGVLTLALLGQLADRVLGPLPAIVTVILAAVYPPFVWLPRRLLSENLALPLAVGALCALVSAEVRRSRRLSLLGGLLLGLGVLVRAAAAFVAGVALVTFAFAVFRHGRGGRGLAIVAALACSITVLPWTLRNRLLFGPGAPLSTLSGLTLYSSYWPPQVGGKPIWGNLAGPDDEMVRRAQTLSNEAEASRFLEAATLRRLAENPRRFFQVLPAKLLSLAVPLDWEILPHPPGASRAWSWGYLIVLPFAVLGATRLWLRSPPGPWPELWSIWVTPVAVFLQALVFYGSPRFRIVAEPFLVVCAAAGVHAPSGKEHPPAPSAPTPQGPALSSPRGSR